MWLLVLGFLQIISSGDTGLLEQSKSQSEYYISNIQKGEDPEANLWALTLLGSEKKEVAAYIEKEVSKRSISSGPLLLFSDFKPSFTEQLKQIVFKTGSPTLLVGLLLEIDNKQQRKEITERFKRIFGLKSENNVQFNPLVNAILEGTEISSNILPTRRFKLSHYFILYSSDRGNLFSKEYLQELIKSWSINSSSASSLPSTLQSVSLFQASYLLNHYSQTASLYGFLITDNLYPNTTLKLNIYRFLDYSMYRLGYYDRNLEIARKFTLPLAEYLNRKSLELRTQFAMGINLYSIGKMNEAKEVYEGILQEKGREYFSLSLSSLYNNLALINHKLGKYNEYLDLQLQSLNAAEKSSDYEHQLEILINLSIYYKQSSDPKTAFRYLEAAQELAEKKGNQADVGKVSIFLGSFSREINKNYNKAHTYYSKARKLIDSNNNVQNYIFVLNEQAEAFEEQGQYQKALQKHEEIIALSPEKSSPHYIDALVNKAVIYLKLDDLDQVESLIEEFKNYDLSQLDFNQVVKAETVEADYLFRKGKNQRALAILRPALQHIVDRAKSSGDLETGYWHVENEYLDAFELATSILINQGQPEKAVEILDQLKTVNDASLYQNPLVKSSLLNESELTQYKQLAAQLDQSRKKLLTADEGDRFSIQQTINRLNNKKSKFDRRLTKKVEQDPISVRDVQNRLSAYELVLHVTELNNQYYISHITRSDVQIQSLPFDSTKRALFTQALEQVATHETNLDSLYALTHFLGLQEIPDHINKVTIIPDTYLYQLPIDILPMEKPDHSYSYGETTYFIEQFETRYLTSLNDFASPDEKGVSSGFPSDFVGYGVSEFQGQHRKSLVPLPFAETEVKMITKKLSNLPDKQIYLDQASTKKTFNRTAATGRILHLATHSKISERDPLFSSIHMHSSAEADSSHENQIYAYELFQLNLNNELVMLNSCESGSGPHLQGTGVMGISRALQYAGAHSLILNLWSVNDMLASDFAIHFYDQLNEGKSKAAALRATKRYFLENKNASPHFWGPYMLIGNDQPVVKPHKEMNLIVAGTFSFYFLVMVSLSYLQNQGLLFFNNKKKAA